MQVCARYAFVYSIKYLKCIQITMLKLEVTFRCNWPYLHMEQEIGYKTRLMYPSLQARAS
jgi:hypothetical protein